MVEINPNLVMSMIQVIDVAAQKGTFTGKDLTAVGKIREQLEEVLSPLEDQVKQLKAEAAAETESKIKKSEK
jgi:hypothetical protein